MELTSLYLLVLVYSMVSVSAEVQNSGDVMRASLSLSPDRSQFFRSESVFLSCEDRQSDSTVWRVKRTSSKNITSECGHWGKMNTSGCLIRSIHPGIDDGVYWCESSKGQSNTVNITVTDGDVILGMPVLPVMEGSDVTLHCWSRTERTAKPSSDRPADFYKDGSLISSESTGQMTIHSVSKSDEGFYKCNISGLGESPESSMDVRDSSSDSPASEDNGQPDLPSSSSPPPSSSLPPYFYLLVFSGVSMVLLVLGLCIWKKKRGCRTDRQSEDVTYATVTVKQPADQRQSRDQTSAEQDMCSSANVNTDQATVGQDIYSTVKKNTDQTAAGQAIYSTVKI